MKKPQPSDGFLLSFVMNLIIHFQWGIAVAVMLILWLWLKVSFWFVAAAMLIWVGCAAISAGIMVWGNQCSNAPSAPQKPNLNPYSAKNTDYGMKKVEEAEVETQPEQQEEENPQGGIRGLDE